MRTTDEIITTMDSTQAKQPALAGLTSTSTNSIFASFKRVFASAAQALESLWEAKQDQLNAIAEVGGPGSINWLRKKAFEFQYDSTVPQLLVVLKNGVPGYQTVDPSKRIISRCSFDLVAGVVELRVAKSEPPQKLTASELLSLQGIFCNTGDGTDNAVGFGYGGQTITCLSYDPDKLFLRAEIKYTAARAKTIVADCLAAIEAYASNLGPKPVFRTIDLVQALQGVPGFIDISIEDLKCRPDSTPFPGGTALVTAYETLATGYDSVAGYMVGETETGNTLEDTLTFTAI